MAYDPEKILKGIAANSYLQPNSIAGIGSVPFGQPTPFAPSGFNPQRTGVGFGVLDEPQPYNNPFDPFGLDDPNRFNSQLPSQVNREGVHWLDKSVRFVTNALEPLQLPADMLQATIAGARDSETTIAERWGRIQWGAYFDSLNPFNGEDRIAERPTTGKEILGLFGWKSDGLGAKVAGFAIDVLADPLLVGGLVRLGGTVLVKGGSAVAARAAAASSGRAALAAGDNLIVKSGQGLVKFGDMLDSVWSPGAYYRGLETIAPQTKGLIDSRLAAFLSPLVSNKMPWNKGVFTLADQLLSEKAALRLRFGSQELADEIFAAKRLAGAGANDNYDRYIELIANMNAKFMGYPDVRTYMKEAERGFRRFFKGASQFGDGMSTKTRQVGLALGMEVSRARGLAYLDDVTIPELQGVWQAAKAQKGGLEKAKLLDVLGTNPDTIFESAINRFVKVAKEDGLSPGYARKKFESLYSDIVQLDSLIGYHASGYENVKRRLFDQMNTIGAEPAQIARLWDSLQVAGYQGNLSKFLDSPTNISPRVTEAIEKPTFDISKVIEGINKDTRIVREKIIKSYQGEIDRRIERLTANYFQTKASIQQVEVNFMNDIKFRIAEKNKLEGMLAEYHRSKKFPDEVPLREPEAITGVPRQGVGRPFDAQGNPTGADIGGINVRNVGANEGLSPEAFLRATEDAGQHIPSNKYDRAYYYLSEGITPPRYSSDTRPRSTGQYTSAQEIELETGVNDILGKARRAFDAGLIRSADDLRRFEKMGYPPVSNRLLGEAQRGRVDKLNELQGINFQEAQAARKRSNAGRAGAIKRQVDRINKDILHRIEDFQVNGIRDLKQRGLMNDAEAIQGSNKLKEFVKELGEIQGKLDNHNFAIVDELIQGAKGLTIEEVPTNVVRKDFVTDSIMTNRKAANPNATAEQLNKNFSVREILDSIPEFQSLGLQEFFTANINGHLKRSFGFFQGKRQADSWIEAIEAGRIIPSSVLDEVEITTKLGNKVGGVIRNYFDTLKDAAGNRQISVKKTDLVNHLLESGLSNSEVRDTMAAFISHVNPALTKFADELKPISARYEDVSKGLRDGPRATLGRGSLQERQSLDNEFLEKLGEIMNPEIALIEQARSAKTYLPAQNFLTELYKIAEDHGLVSKEKQMGMQQVPLNDSSYWGGFANKWVHPQLKKEIQKAITAPQERHYALTRIRNAITGSFLANPGTNASNAIGGIYTAWQAGVDPGEMISAMARNANDVWKFYAEGTASPLIQDLQKYIDIGSTSRISADAKIKLSELKVDAAAIEQLPIGKAFDSIMNSLERQMKAPFSSRRAGVPGIGLLGLDGFQYIETLLKVAAFDASLVQKVKLRGAKVTPDVMRNAAETARVAVFDYSELPQSLKWLRDRGLVLFPGFQYFSLGRNMSAMLNKPGTIAAAERIPDALANATLSEEEKMITYHSMADWLREARGAPYRLNETPTGKRVSILPLNNIIPSNPLGESQFQESLVTGGLWKPFVEAAWANLQGDGTAIFSQRYGQRVFEDDATGFAKLGQTTSFVLNNMTPSLVKKIGLAPQDIGRLASGQSSGGLIGAVRANLIPVPDELAGAINNIQEAERNKAVRDLADEVLAASFRSPQVIALTGPLAALPKRFNSAKFELNKELKAIKDRHDNALLRNNTEEVERLKMQYAQKQEEFFNRWSPILAAGQSYGLSQYGLDQ